MDIHDRVCGVVEALKEAYPDPRCALEYKKDYELMIAVRLSAQCTDERVNKITPALFARYPSLESLAEADIAEVEEYVRSCGFYHNKARDIVLSCQMLLSRFGGKVPGTMDASGRGQKNRKSAAWRPLWRPRLGRLRHALHPHLEQARPC